MIATAAPRWAPLLWLTMLTGLTLTVTAPSGLAATVASAALVLIAVALAVGLGVRILPATGRLLGVSLRARSRRVGVLRQRDPDAAGRARPRAPSH